MVDRRCQRGWTTTLRLALDIRTGRQNQIQVLQIPARKTNTKWPTARSCFHRDFASPTQPVRSLGRSSNSTMPAPPRLRWSTRTTGCPHLLVPSSTLIVWDSGCKPGSTRVTVYTGTAPYKLIITDDDDATIISLDNIRGALDTSTFLTTGSASTLTQPVITKTADYTIGAADRSKLVQGNTTGGQFTLTLTAAATLGDNWSVKIRNSGTANQFILSSPQAVSFEGQTFTARAFQPGEGCELICDGTGIQDHWLHPAVDGL